MGGGGDGKGDGVPLGRVGVGERHRAFSLKDDSTDGIVKGIAAGLGEDGGDNSSVVVGIGDFRGTGNLEEVLAESVHGVGGLGLQIDGGGVNGVGGEGALMEFRVPEDPAGKPVLVGFGKFLHGDLPGHRWGDGQLAQGDVI